MHPSITVQQWEVNYSHRNLCCPTIVVVTSQDPRRPRQHRNPSDLCDCLFCRTHHASNASQRPTALSHAAGSTHSDPWDMYLPGADVLFAC